MKTVDSPKLDRIYWVRVFIGWTKTGDFEKIAATQSVAHIAWMKTDEICIVYFFIPSSVCTFQWDLWICFTEFIYGSKKSKECFLMKMQSKFPMILQDVSQSCCYGAHVTSSFPVRSYRCSSLLYYVVLMFLSLYPNISNVWLGFSTFGNRWMKVHRGSALLALNFEYGTLWNETSRSQQGWKVLVRSFLFFYFYMEFGYRSCIRIIVTNLI